MARLRGRDVARLEGDVVAQVWRNPRDEDLPEGKRLVAVDHGTVTVGMIYDGQRFSKPEHKTAPVVVVQEAIQHAPIAPFSIPPPLPKPKQLASDSPQSNSIVVNVHGDGSVGSETARQPHQPPHQDRALSGNSIQSGHQGGEPAASAAPHPLPPNVASTSLSREFGVNSDASSVNSQQDPIANGEIQHPVINIHTSIDETKRDAADYIERQAHEVLKSIPSGHEILREAIAQTVVQAEAVLSKCTNVQQVKAAVHAVALSFEEYIDQAKAGRFG